MSPTVPARFSTGFVLPLGAALGVVLVGAGWLHDHDRRVRETARLTDALATSQRHEAQLGDSLRVASARVVHDSVYVAHDITRYRALRDTLVLTDTVAVKEFVERADSVVRSCTELQSSCARFRVYADSTLAAKDSTISLLSRAVEQAKPSRWDKVKFPVGLLVGGLIIRAVR